MKVVILGANGFVGHHLTAFLVKRDLELVLFSRKFDSEIRDLGNKENVQIVKGELQDHSLVSQVLEGADIVYHLIWTSVPSSSWDTPYEEVVHNVLPGIKLLEACVDQKVKKVVFVSSAGTVYGEYHEVANEKSPVSPFSPYGINKATMEFYLEYFSRRFDLHFDIFRISNLYGPGQKKKDFGVINTWLRKIKEGEPLTMLGDGNAKKDFVFIDDAIKILVDSLESDFSKSRLFNVCSSESVSLKQLADLLFKVCQKKTSIIFERAKASDNREVFLSNDLLLEERLIDNFTTLESGITRIWEAMNVDKE